MTPRQTQVTKLASEGYSNKQIAEKLGIVEQTVKNLMHKAYRSMGISTPLYHRNTRLSVRNGIISEVENRIKEAYLSEVDELNLPQLLQLVRSMKRTIKYEEKAKTASY